MATLSKRITGFLAGAKVNGNSGFKILLDTLDHWREHNDPVHFLRLVGNAAPSDAKQFRLIASQIVSGAKPDGTAMKDQQIAFDAKAMGDMRALANDGASFRAFQKGKAKTEGRASVPYAEKLAAAAKAAHKQDATLDEFLAAAKAAYQEAVANA